MHLTEYETTLAIRPDVGGEAIEGILDRIRDVLQKKSGKLLAIDHWGRRKLAYEIEKHGRAIYVYVHYLGQQDLVAEIERHLRIVDAVLRFLTVRLAKDVEVSSREEKAYVKPQYDLQDTHVEEGPLFGVDDTDHDEDCDFDRDEEDEEEIEI